MIISKEHIAITSNALNFTVKLLLIFCQRLKNKKLNTGTLGYILKALTYPVPAVLCKKKKLIIVLPFFDTFKLCKIAPKFAMIMQTVQKY